MSCSDDLRKQGKAYPRTCQDCGLGPCKAMTTSTTPAAAVSLHDLIMNLRGEPATYDYTHEDAVIYKFGHRDARHAAAELATARESALIAERDHMEGNLLKANEVIEGLVAERDQLRAALQRVVDWGPFPRVPDRGSKFPDATISYSFAYGSNGERDYIRDIAARALAAPAVEG